MAAPLALRRRTLTNPRLIRRLAMGSFPAYAVLIALFIYYLIIDPSLLSSYQIMGLLDLATPFILAAFAQSIVILTGGIDLSVGSVIGLSNVVAATTFTTTGGMANGAQAVGLALAAGIVAGLGNGLLVAVGRLPAIIVTLATLSLWEGVTLHILPAPGGFAPAPFTNALTGTTASLPNALFLLVPTILVLWIVMRRTRSGRAIFAVGDDEGAAYMTGIAVVRAKILAYVLSGFLAALAGLFVTALTSTGDPLVNQDYTLNSVAAVVIGGASLAGGIGSIWGAIAGAGILAIVIALLPFANISSFWQTIFSGVILVAALAIRSVVTLAVNRS
jgi:ribose transport system permease protein